MRDLISRSEAVKALHEYAEQKFAGGEVELANGILKAKCFLENGNVPTAYDVEAVVAELENFEMWKELLIYDLSHREREIIEKAISIVRGKE